jgi:hypothetical protein
MVMTTITTTAKAMDVAMGKRRGTTRITVTGTTELSTEARKNGSGEIPGAVSHRV